MGHVVKRTVGAVVVVCGAQYIVEVLLVGGIGGAAAVGCLASYFAGEGGAALVDPHVALGFAGDEVAEPGVAELMGYGALAGLCDRGHGLASKGDIVDVLHGAECGADVAYASPAVGAETLLKLGHHGVEERVDVGGDGAVLGCIAYGDGDAAGSGVDAVEVGLSDADEVGAYGMFDVPD